MSGFQCRKCGKNNIEGAVFCQQCGERIPAPEAKKSAAVACTSCSVENSPGSSFCKACGKPLAAAVVPKTETVPEKMTCAQCGTQVPTGYAFCQHCGSKLIAATTAAAPVAERSPTPPQGKPSQGAAQTAAAMTGHRSTTPESTAPSSQSHTFGRLVMIRRDGTDGEIVPIGGEQFDIGRTEGHLNFAEDAYLAPRHARFFRKNGAVHVRPLDGLNGVFMRSKSVHVLHNGDRFIVGKELLCFELPTEEQDITAVTEHGVRCFGSALKSAWGRLRQITVAGTARNVWYLSRPEIVIGREEGDFLFPDDEFMSRKHVRIKKGGQIELEDLKSSNGTYVRLRGDRSLLTGDVLRLGDQLIRFESA